MKRNMNRVLSIVAMLMLTVGAWAERTMTINVMPENAGTVVASEAAAGETCTLTVTTNEGFYLKSISAVATLDGGALQAPKRTLPVNDGVLDITADPNDATKYSFTMPDEGCNITITAEFYGGVSFDASTNTLTLTNANIESGDDWAFEFDSNVSMLNVKLVGENTIDGNAFKFANSKPALVFTTDPITPGSLTIPSANSLTSPAEGDNATAVYYENGLKLAVSENSKMISGVAINLRIGGVQVTSQNMNDIFGDGTVSFSVSLDKAKTLTKMLTLNNAEIDMTQKDGYPIECDVEDLKVLLIGNNVFTGKDYGFYYTNASNQGTLTFTHEVNGFGSLTVNNGTIANNGYSVEYNTKETGWTCSESAIEYDALFGVQIGNTEFKASTLTIGSENASATYNPATQTLSLNNFTTTDAITTKLTNLTISLKGANSVGAVLNNEESASDTITIQRDAMSDAAVNKLLATSIDGFEMMTIVDPLKDISSNTQVIISDVVTYNLWVNDIQVTKENMNAIISGVSFDGDRTLKFDGVNASTDGVPFITNGLSKLIINLVGTNVVNCKQQPFLAKKEGDNDHQVTFTTVNAAGDLTLNNVDEEWCTGHTMVLQNKLEEQISEGTITIIAPSEEYGLTIAGVAVTNLNAASVSGANITGSVSYNATTNVLTLNGATINGDITANMAELYIALKGENSVSGFDRTLTGKTDLTISLGGETGKLDLTSAISDSKFSVTLKDRLELKNENKEISLPTSYGISVAGTDITSSNRRKVTGANLLGSVQFDNNAQLILEDATINGEIVIADAASLPNNTLKIYLEGKNIINLGEGQKAIKCTNGTLTLEFTMGEQKSATLVVNTYDDKVTTDDILSGVTSTFDGLSVTSIADDKVCKIAAALPPVVNNDKQQGGVDFSNMPPTSNMNNTNIDGLLVTGGNETDDYGNTNGIVDGELQFLGSAEMTMNPAKLKQITATPGTPEYAQQFIGVTFTLPSGVSTVDILSYITDPQYAFYLQVGEQEPIEVTYENAVATMKSFVITLVMSQTTTVQLYLMKKTQTSEAPEMANRRIGPKSSIAGGLGGITIKSNMLQQASQPASTYKALEPAAFVSSLASLGDVISGYKCNDSDITDLPDDMFVDKTSAPAFHRAGKVKTILPEDLTFLDFSDTKITGKEISRSEGSFNGVPENVFIYVPAGNTTKEKNVIIGGVCDQMELDGEKDAKPFKAMKNFTAGQVVLKRTFPAAGTGENKVRSTIYLPYAVSQEDANSLGSFYEYESNDGKVVSMTKVTTGGLKANKPYIFEAKEGGVENPLIRVASVVATPGETEGFKGVFERKEYEPGMYCYAAEARDNNTVGQFVEMGPGSYVPPFRAYMIGNSVPSYAIAWDGVIDKFVDEENTTAVETLKTVADKKTAEGWWTLNGVRMNAQPKKAGLYIFNGKMVVVK